MQIPILNGIYADSSPQLRTAYPVNLVPVPKKSGISNGFLRPGDGLVQNGTGPGIDRGGINWRDELYRVMGTKLVLVGRDGTVTTLGDVGGPVDEMVTMDYGFGRLAIASGGRLYYWDEVSLVQVTDPDLGIVLDVVWVDGYFMTTDGDSLVVTELSDPTQINPLKYGSSEVDPDPVVALLKLRNEVYALNRNTIEVFDNVGGEFFPFARIPGAQITRGVVGTQACCTYLDAIAFLGSSRNQPPGIFLGVNARSDKISTQEIDNLLLEYTEAELSVVKLESRNDRSHQFLYVHLPDRAVVYDAAASQDLGEPVWFTLTSSLTEYSQYRGKNMVWAYDKWLIGDTQSPLLGFFVQDISTHWEQIVYWEFGTMIVYNEGNGVIFNELELVSLTGSVALGSNPTITTSYSTDGMSFSQERAVKVGTTGSTKKRLVWFQQGHMRNFRIQRFKGNSQAHLSFMRLEAQLDPLAY
jgi:hypothetical protein